MDVERTINQILESQVGAERRAKLADQRAEHRAKLIDQRAEQRAKLADERFDRADKRYDRADLRADRAEQRAQVADRRMDRFDKQLEATANLLRGGMKIVLAMRKETEFKLNALTDSQMRTDEAMRKTDEKFNRLLEALKRKSTNGLR